VKLVEDEFGSGNARPVGIRPAKVAGIDDPGWTMHASRLVPTRRVRTHPTIVEAVEIVETGLEIGLRQLMDPVLPSVHGQHLLGTVRSDVKGQALRGWSPNREPNRPAL
jgi:hypothetical protein